MTTWSMETVHKVRRLFVEVLVDPTFKHHGQMPAVREKAAKALAGEAHALAVEVHIGDVQFEEHPPTDERFQIRLVAHWQPMTREVELRGGECDGTLLEVQRIGDSLRVAQGSVPIWLTQDTEPTVPLPRAITFDLDGWDETERHWVYRAEPAPA